MLEKIVNVDLLKNPVNWAVVLLMVASAALALHLIFPTPEEE